MIFLIANNFLVTPALPQATKIGILEKKKIEEIQVKQLNFND